MKSWATIFNLTERCAVCLSNKAHNVQTKENTMSALTAIKSAAIELTIPREVVELAMFASKDENRHNLAGIHIESIGPGKLVAVATDGYRMAKFEFDGNLPGTLLIDAAALKGLKAKGSVNVYQLDGRCTLTCGATSVTAPANEGQFPDWRQVMPGATDTRCGSVGVNPQYLADVAVWARKAGLGSNLPIRLELGVDGGSPMTVTLSGVPGFTCVVMPCRV